MSRDVPSPHLRVDAGLRHGEDAFRRLVESADDLVFLYDLSGRIVYYHGPERLGLDPDHVAGKTLHDFFPEEEASRLVEQIRQVAASGKAMTVENYVTWKDDTLWFSDHIFPVRGAEGQIVGVAKISRNVTRQKWIEAALCETERRYRRLVEGTDNIVLQLNAKGRLTFINQTAQRRFGISPVDCVGLPWLDFIAPDDRRRTEEAFQTWLRTGTQSASLENSLCDMTGSVRRILWSANVRADEQGGTTVDLVGRDITELRAAEQKAQFLGSVTRQIRDAIVVTGFDFRIVYVNAATEKLFEYGEEELRGKNPQVLMCEPQAAELERVIEQTIAAGGVWSGEIRWRSKGGREFFGEVKVSPLAEDQATRIGYIGVIRDVSERKRAEKELRASEAKYRAVIDGSLQGIVLLDDREILLVNPAMAEAFGYSIERLQGMPIREALQLVHPEDRPMVTQRLADRLAGKPVPPRYEFRILREDGQERWVEIFVTPFRHFGARTTQAVFIDITDRKRAEVQLREAHEELERRVAQRTAELSASNRRLVEQIEERRQAEQALRESRRLIENISDATPTLLLIYDLLEGRAVYGNRRVTELFGLAPGDLSSLDDRLLCARFHREDLPAHLQFLSNLEDLGDGEVADTEFRLQDTAGRWRWMRASHVVFSRTPEGRVQRVLASLTDISQSKEAQLEMRVKESAIDTAINAIIFADLEGNLTYVNPVCLQWWGYEDENEVLGRPAIGFCSDPAKALVALRTVQSEGAWTGELVAQRKDGSVFDVQLVASRVSDATGKPVALMASFMEITHRKQAEAALRRAERLASIGTLAAGMAHEINNPIGGIAMYAAAARRSRDLPDWPEVVDTSLRNIEEEAHRCGQIVRSVLQFARKESTSRWPGCLTDAANNARDLIRHLAKRRRIDIRLESPDDLPDLVMNPTEMSLMVVNLLTNAIEASADGSAVTIRIEAGDGCLRLHVEDRGSGMTDDELKQIFDPFYTTRHERGGTGLGLSICYGIVSQHGGTIDVQSAPGQGTTVIVTLPVTAPGE